MGDDTWMQLFPHQFGDAAPFPSFNVQDLHTVDNGVWQVWHSAALPLLLHRGNAPSPGATCQAQTGCMVYAPWHDTTPVPVPACCKMHTSDRGRLALLQYLVPAIRNASGWDVLIGHYLGVDHAGHTDDVFAPTMAAKLAQLDAEVAQVSEWVRTKHAGHEGDVLFIWTYDWEQNIALPDGIHCRNRCTLLREVAGLWHAIQPLVEPTSPRLHLVQDYMMTSCLHSWYCSKSPGDGGIGGALWPARQH